jgi:hypothetical protein
MSLQLQSPKKKSDNMTVLSANHSAAVRQEEEKS